ncbi:aspartate/tyrosine/aromatic aminotransferase [Psychromarinibacter sp. C21-152]|uniref:Aminotransferase n=1 Tax=Psychromarinibacter sediminicola TaxID=3033385 RepID=A0AAE3NN33_9RHOB|nr:amino acid aminotransferase [Psychromarinibacter sediminicola]MDF0600978.1 aspartate/tyrosine/aromatic aminotransferase [Psychromarinibacter sediminicola]
MFENYKSPAPDVILELMQQFRADPRPEKIDLGIGVYKTGDGKTPVMQAVKDAERQYIEQEQTKAYLGLAGDADFVDRIRTLVLDDAVSPDCVRGIQTVGGGAAVRLLADMLAANDKCGRIWIPSPTWINHVPISKAAGLEVVTYTYFDPATGQIDFDGMLDDLGKAEANDIVLLHGCCHNPTGADLTLEQWRATAALIAERGLLPFVDIAYQGFGDGLEEDAAGVRLLAGTVPEMVISTSCSKNFGVYRDRVGTAMIIGDPGAGIDKAREVLLSAGRVNYSFPPNHGAATISLLLSDPTLTSAWKSELDEMRQRILGNREALAQTLRSATNSDRFDFVRGHKGMFSLLGLSAEQITQLRNEAAVFMPPDGRMNIAAINEADLDVIGKGIAAVIR